MTSPTHRIRCAPGFEGQSSRFDGRIIGLRIHDSNGMTMARLEFVDADHQKLFGGTWLYLDDLETLNPTMLDSFMETCWRIELEAEALR